MKRTQKTLALCLMATLSISTVWAQSDEQVLNSDPINVDGYVNEPKPATDTELEQIRGELTKQKTMTQLNKDKSKELGKLSQQTEKLIDSQDEYIDSKVESQAAIKEFNKKSAENEVRLRCLMEESNSKECEKYVKKSRFKTEEPAPMVDQVNTGLAAPVQQVVAPVAAPVEPLKPFEEIKLLPYAGVTNYNGSVEKLETQFVGGLRVESNINNRLSLGIGFSYGQFTTKDYANNYNNYGYSVYNGFTGMYGNYREIKFTNLGFDFYGKFFITRGERFRPYLGAGLSYNRMTLNYTGSNDTYAINQYYSFGNEELTSSFAAGSLSAGSEILITRNIGLNVEFQYSRGLGDALNTNNQANSAVFLGQERLNELSDEIIQSNALSIFAGMVVIF